jgi:DNA (cytosine-5)-methyltransferase 1
MTLKILNLYAGIGGNRKLWGGDIMVTAIEINPKIANVYQTFFPNDKVVVGDAHQYLLGHYKEFDFIWSSPPCTSHTGFAKLCGNSDDFRSGNHKKDAKFPDMKLYEEIIFLENYFNGKWVVENVIPYYPPLIKAKKIQRHLFWSNFPIGKIDIEGDNIKHGKIREWEKKLGFDLSKYKNVDKRAMLRNCVNPYLSAHIFNMAFTKPQRTLL